MQRALDEKFSKPVTEWFNDFSINVPDVAICSDGERYVKRYTYAKDAWEACRYPSYLLKAALACKVCTTYEYLQLILHILEIIPYADSLKLQDSLNKDNRLLVVHGLLKQYLTTGDKEDAKALYPHRNVMYAASQDNEILERRIASIFHCNISTIDSNWPYVEVIASNLYTLVGSADRGMILISKIIKDKFKNPFVVNNEQQKEKSDD